MASLNDIRDLIWHVRLLTYVLIGCSVYVLVSLFADMQYETPLPAEIRTTIGQGCFKDLRKRGVMTRLVDDLEYGQPGGGCSDQNRARNLRTISRFFVDDFWYDCPFEERGGLPCGLTSDVAPWIEQYRSRVYWVDDDGRRMIFGLDFIDAQGRVVGTFGTPAAFDAHYRNLRSGYEHKSLVILFVLGIVILLLFLLRSKLEDGAPSSTPG